MPTFTVEAMDTRASAIRTDIEAVEREGGHRQAEVSKGYNP